MLLVHVDALHDFQNVQFPAGGNQAIANGTVRFNDTGVGFVRQQNERCCGVD
jgi:hypothetical protein